MEGDDDSEKFKKVFQKAMLETAQYGVTIGEVNCVNHTKICEKANLDSIPELRLRLFVFIIISIISIVF